MGLGSIRSNGCGEAMACRSLRCLVLLLIVAADPAFAAPPDRLTLDYEVYVGGLRLLKARAMLDLAPDAYGIRLDAALEGVPALFADWWAVTTSEGRVVDGAVVPRHHRIERLHRGVVKTIDMAYDAGGTIAVVFDPPRDDLVPIDPADMAGAIDPLTALVAMIERISAGGACSGTIKAFDGRRRYDLVFAEGGPATLAPNRYSPYAGPALRCRMRQVPVAGDWDWGEETGSKAPRERAADIWLAAPVAGAPVVPVRVEGEVWIGRF